MGPDALPVKLHINGREHSVVIEPRDTLAQTLRDNLGLTGTKVVCDRGSCSACTVWIDKTPALACMTLAIDTTGRQITTIEGLSHGDHDASRPGRLCKARRDAMRLLHSGHGHELCRPAGAQSEPKPERREARRERQPVPLRNLPESLCGDPGCCPAARRPGHTGQRNGGLRCPRYDGPARDRRKQTRTAKRTENFVFGIPQNGLEHKQREVLLDEPPPLGPNSELMYIGKPTVRYDGPAKAMGTGKYTADVHLPGMLYARMVDATIPHGRIVSIDTSAAEKLPGVRAVHVIEHVYGVAELRDPKQESPSRYPVIRYAGQPIAAVAATSQQIADDAAKLVKVQYDAMPFVVDRTAARAADAPVVFPGPADEAASAGGGGGPKDVPQTGNVHGPQRKQSGDLEKGFAEADVIVESEYFTQVQTHSALETHGFVVDWKPEEVTVYASTQGTSSVREEFADVFKLPKSKVRVITEYMGGGFGAKFGAGNEGVVAANLSRKANAPVKLMLDRRQEHIVCNRPDSHQQLKIGARKRRNADRHQADQLWNRRSGHRSRNRRPGNQFVQVPEPADGRERCLHQRRPGRGISCAWPPARLLRL